MARHVPAHRWADAAAGNVSSVQLSAMEEHAEGCPRCAGVRDRVRAAHRGFADIREADSPRLNWEHIGARIYWVTSSERRQAARLPRHARARSPWVYASMLAGGVAVALGVVALWPDDGGARPAARPAPAPSTSIAHDDTGTLQLELIPDTAPEPLRGLVTYREGEVLVGGAELGIDHVLAAGDVVTTGDGGRVTVQFGDASGFTLAPGSTLEVRALDTRAVELVLAGDIVVDVAHRAPDQRFEVLAGDRVVSVRGTIFEVSHRAGALAVACARGKVSVRDTDSEREVAAGQHLELARGETLSKRAPVALADAAAEVLEREVGVRLLPVWSGAYEMTRTSATLELAGRRDKPVLVDGELVGSGRFQFRVISGRHHVDVGDGGQWIRAGAGEAVDAIEAPPPPRDRASDVRARRADLDRALGNGARARGCLRSLEKQGLLAGSFVELDIGVNRDGSLGHLNIRRTNVPTSDAACVRSVVDSVRLPRGERATLRYRIEY